MNKNRKRTFLLLNLKISLKYLAFKNSLLNYSYYVSYLNKNIKSKHKEKKIRRKIDLSFGFNKVPSLK